MTYPTPHGDKLRALLENNNLPTSDRPGVDIALERYEAWITEMQALDGVGRSLVEPLVMSLNRYKKLIDLDLIFDSKNDFLYRQKGQLKLDNSVLEEFLTLENFGRKARILPMLLQKSRRTSTRRCFRRRALPLTI